MKKCTICKTTDQSRFTRTGDSSYCKKCRIAIRDKKRPGAQTLRNKLIRKDLR